MIDETLNFSIHLQGSLESAKDGMSVGLKGTLTNQTAEVKNSNMAQGKAFSSRSSVLEISSAEVSPVKVDTCFSNVLSNLRPVSKATVVVANALPSSYQLDKAQEKFTHFQDASETVSNAEQDTMGISSETDSSLEKNSEIGEFDDEEALSRITMIEETGDNIVDYLACIKAENGGLSGKDEKSIQEKEFNKLNDKPRSDITEGFTTAHALADTDAYSTNKEYLGSDISGSTRLKHVKSVRSLSSFSKNDTLDRCYRLHEEVTKAVGSVERKELKYHSRGSSTFTENRVQILEQRVEILEAELREAAAIEVALYSVVAEHGSSKNKVHAPARRLSRLYLHASEERSRVSAAKSSVSGLVLVAKACGNDVPRYFFFFLLRYLQHICSNYIREREALSLTKQVLLTR